VAIVMTGVECRTISVRWTVWKMPRLLLIPDDRRCWWMMMDDVP